MAQEYGLDQSDFVRPFWPNTEFEQFDYPAECIVVDNPPFSIRARIVDFYTIKGIRYFLFSPALVMLKRDYVCHIATGANITYENGAVVPTSFITNLETCVLRTAPDLYQAIKQANQDNLKAIHKQLPKYAYPDHIVTLAIAQRWSHYGIDYRLDPEDCTRISALDSQRAKKKTIFGGGLLLSERAAAERAAAERAAAERAAAEVWTLSNREMGIVQSLGKAKPDKPTLIDQL